MQVTSSMEMSNLIGRQLGRIPRSPFRVVGTCAYGFPQVIASPSVLEDGARFPNWTYLTCPYLGERAYDAESAGRLEDYRNRATADEQFATSLKNLDDYVRIMRAREGSGLDVCESVGLAGQANSAAIKCLHAHLGYALAGAPDIIGLELLNEFGPDCTDGRCLIFAEDDVSCA